MSDVAKRVAEWLPLLVAPGDPVELRFLHVGRPGRTHGGWVRGDQLATVAGKVAALAREAGACYFLPQRLAPTFLDGRKRGHFARIRKDAPAAWRLATDADVVARRYLLVDVDPVREPAGVCSTGAEKESAREVADAVRGELHGAGWADPLIIDSGNGWHLYYRLPAELPGGPSDSGTDPLARLLHVLADKCNNGRAVVDTTVYNASRIMKIPGTWARKGHNSKERPHRQSAVVEVPADWPRGEAINLGDGPRLPCPAGRNWFTHTLDALDSDGSIRERLSATRPTAPALATSAPILPAGLDAPSPELVEKRARAYLRTLPPGIQGQNGSGATYAAACALVHGFAVSPTVALAWLLQDYNPRCVPEWTEAELRHKVEDAARKDHKESRGYLLARGGDQLDQYSAAFGEAADIESRTPITAGPALAPSPATVAPVGQSEALPAGVGADDRGEAEDDPYRIARGILARYLHGGRPTLAYWHSEFYHWTGARWEPRDRSTWHASVNLATRAHFEAVYDANVAAARRGEGDINDVPRKGKVTRQLVSNVIAAIEAQTSVDLESAPAWIGSHVGPAASEIVPARNGLVNLPALAEGRPDAIIPPTPAFFNLNAVTFNVEAAPAEPVEWLRFLATVWPNDRESVNLLQEWLGYLLTSDNSQQKALLMIGPKRSGKGTICAVIRALVGMDNCTAPTLSGLAGPFGLAPLLGKSVALVEDARLSGRADGVAVGERILLITGGGAVTIDRKHLDAVTTILPTRFVLATNEAPRLTDLSGALASRWSVLQFVNSFIGREDIKLLGRLLAELPGIFKWAAEGWARLRRQGRFTSPAASADAVEMIEESGSPIGVFLADRCEVGPAFVIDADELYAEWGEWCGATGRREPGTREEFGRQLRAALPEVRRVQIRSKDAENYGERVRVYKGLRLSVTGVTGELALHALQIFPEENSTKSAYIEDSPVTPVTPVTGETEGKEL